MFLELPVAHKYYLFPNLENTSYITFTSKDQSSSDLIIKKAFESCQRFSDLDPFHLFYRLMNTDKREDPSKWYIEIYNLPEHLNKEDIGYFLWKTLDKCRALKKATNPISIHLSMQPV